MEKIQIVTLAPSEWETYKNLRLRALKEEPQAFASTYEENLKNSDESWMKRLESAEKGKTQWLVFAKLDDQVVGMMGAFAEKEVDNAHVIAVYIIKEARGLGISTLLMKDLLTRIKQNKLVKKITVEVNPEQEAALHLYKSAGFQIVKKYKMVLGDKKEHEVIVLEMLVN